MAKCLDSVMAQSFNDFEFVNIDNGSSDGTKDFLENYFKDNKQKHSLTFNKKNLGFAAGHNQAINKATSEYILCLNQDIILESDYLEKLVEFMDNNEKAAAASGKLLVWDDTENKKTKIIDSLGLELKPSWQVVEKGSGEVDCQGKKAEPRPTRLRRSRSGRACSAPKKVFGVSATAPLYRRSALEEIKFKNQYFDELFFSFKEDIDLSFRLNKKSWQSWLVPEARSFHIRTASYRGQGNGLDIARSRKQKSSQVNYWSYRNHWYLLIKHMSKEEFKKNFAWIVPYELKKLAYVLLFEWGSLKAFKDIVINWKKL